MRTLSKRTRKRILRRAAAIVERLLHPRTPLELCDAIIAHAERVGNEPLQPLADSMRAVRWMLFKPKNLDTLIERLESTDLVE